MDPYHLPGEIMYLKGELQEVQFKIDRLLDQDRRAPGFFNLQELEELKKFKSEIREAIVPRPIHLEGFILNIFSNR